MSVSSDFNKGFIGSIPIMTGYIPIAIAYGVIGTQSGIPAYVIVSMSVFIYAGASQFMAINLFALNTPPLQMMITIGVINLRHIVMGLSFQNKFKFNITTRIVTSLGLTDETFSFLTLNEELTGSYAKGAMLGAYLSWILGAVIGILFGNLIPSILSEGLEIALYTLFITLLVSSLQGQKRLILIPLSSMLCNYLLSMFLPGGIAIVLSILCGAIIGTAQGSFERTLS